MDKRKIYKKAISIRVLENFFLEQFSKGTLNGTVHTCVGQELTPVVVAHHLNEHDKVFSNHRGHGHYLAGDNPSDKLIRELLGKANGISRGVGGSQHLHTENFISNGIQGGLAPISVGYSFSKRLQKNKNISVCYLGDGSLGEGQVYEAFTLAGIFETPSLFIIENNGIAQSTHIKHTLKGSIKQRIKGFGLSYFCSNIWDFDDLVEQAEKAVRHARNGNPTVLEIMCYRLNSHSKGDDNRKKSEITYYEERDLLNKYIKSNSEWYDVYFKKLREAFLETVNEKTDEPFNTKLLENKTVIDKKIDFSKYHFERGERGDLFKDHINDALKHMLSNYQSVIIGEDIVDTTPETPVLYGGAFKVTAGLSTKFPELVKNSSISEAGMTGFGIGCALDNRPCIVEIMFGDFMTLCLDQIVQQASKIPSMYGSPVNLPFVIRTPMGGRRGYGPTHSQNIEKIFLFWPNVDIIALNCLSDPPAIYSAAIENNKLTIVIEDKVSYTQTLMDSVPDGYEVQNSNEKFSTFVITPQFAKPNCTFILYGAMLAECIAILPELFDEEIFPQILCPTRLSPLNVSIFDGIDFANLPCFFIEEGSKRTAWSSEVLATLTEGNVVFKKVFRISNEHIIPCSRELEDSLIPSRKNLTAKIKNFFECF